MEKKINIAELLKDCPKGMELDCSIYENLVFDYIDENNDTFPIKCHIKRPNNICTVCSFTAYGCCSLHNYSKCVIFPKGETTWDGFVPPCNVKDGDVVAFDCDSGVSQVFIFKKIIDKNNAICYVFLDENGSLYIGECNYYIKRHATEEEKQRLFDAIKANGYKWNPDTKTLEKLINRNKFVVGVTITNGKTISKIVSRDVDSYKLEDGTYVFFNEVHNWELVTNKFPITTLKPLIARAHKYAKEDHNESMHASRYNGYVRGALDERKKFAWIKIDRDENGFATEECLDKIFSNLPCVVCSQTEKGYKYYNMVGEYFDMMHNREDIRTNTGYTNYLPIPKLEV